MANLARMNPMQAYIQGREAGAKMTHAENIRQGMKLCYEYLLIAMYNANDRSDEEKNDFLSTPQLNKFYTKVANELINHVNEAIENKENLDSKDIADLHFGHDEFIRKKLKLPLRKYDGKDEVL